MPAEAKGRVIAVTLLRRSPVGGAEERIAAGVLVPLLHEAEPRLAGYWALEPFQPGSFDDLIYG